MYMYLNKIKWVLVLSSLLSLVNCTDELRQASPKPDSRIQKLSLDQIEVNVQGLAQPNLYEVEIKWPEAKGIVRVNEHSKVLGAVSGSDQKFTQSQIPGGSELSYVVEQLSDDGSLLSSNPIYLKIPVDVFWDGVIELSNHEKIEAERVFLSNKAVVTTLDKNLTIIAREFISDGGVIRNFNEGTQASWEKNGRTGGTNSSMAKEARGRL